jgi:hypothetical protein
MRYIGRSKRAEGYGKGVLDMRLHIISDGTVNGTTLIDPETNLQIENCTRIEFVADVDSHLCKAKIYLTDVPVCLTAENIKTDPPESMVYSLPEKYRGENGRS